MTWLVVEGLIFIEIKFTVFI